MIIERKKGGRPSKRPTVEQLALLYRTMTAKQVADELGVSVYTVRNWITKARKEEAKAGGADD